MGTTKSYFNLLFVNVLFLAVGCMSWEPGWKQAAAPAVKGDVTALMARAERLESAADTKEKVQALIAAYEDVVRADPQNIEAHSSLGTYFFLMAYGYAQDDAQMRNNLMRSIGCSERAMYTNPEFKKLADKGENVWQACSVLTEREMNAMFHWYLASGYLLSKRSLVGQLINIRWSGRITRVLERMTAINTSWNSGSVNLCWAVYYAVLPAIVGGDLKKAEEFFDKALHAGPHMISFYEARAKELRTRMKDRKGFVEDLHHAIAIDPRKADTLEYPWAVWHRENAKRLLGDVDRYFE